MCCSAGGGGGGEGRGRGESLGEKEQKEYGGVTYGILLIKKVSSTEC